MEEITYAYPKIEGVDPSCYIDAYNLILECSQSHTPRSFSIKLLDVLKKVTPYDKAIVLFLNSNGKVSGTYTVAFDPAYLESYLNYYIEILAKDSSSFNLYVEKKETSDYTFSSIIDWDETPDSEFKTDYIQPLGLKYSWGFCFFDLLGAYRVVISLDRTRNVPFSKEETDRLNLALPILNNMHRNFFYQGIDSENCVMQTPWNDYQLTSREIEIATLLCQGTTTQNISSALYIAPTTAYKHIAHIFKKVGVASRQELIVKLLGKEEIK